MDFSEHIYLMSLVSKEGRTKQHITHFLKGLKLDDKAYLILFYEYLCRCRPNYPAFMLDRDRILEDMFDPKEGLSLEKRNTLLNFCYKELPKRLRVFLVQVKAQRDDTIAGWIELLWYTAPGQEERFFKHGKKMLKKGLPKNQILRPLFESELRQMLFRHHSAENYFRIESSEYLDTIIFCRKVYSTLSDLKDYCEKLARHLLRGHPLKDGFIDMLKDLVSELGELRNEPLLDLYAQVAELLLYKDNSKFLKLERSFKSQYENLNIGQLDIWRHLHNAVELVSFEEGKHEVYWRLEQLAINKGLVVQNGYIDPEHFMNIVQTFYHRGQIAMADSFVKKNIDCLENSKKYKKFCRLFAQLYRQFQLSEYTPIIEKLSAINVKDYPSPSFGNRHFILISKALFMRDGSKAEMTIEYTASAAMRYWLHKTTKKVMSKDRKKMYTNFFYILLLIIQEPVQRRGKETLREKLDEKKDKIAGYEWLRKQIEMLKE